MPGGLLGHEHGADSSDYRMLPVLSASASSQEVFSSRITNERTCCAVPVCRAKLRLRREDAASAATTWRPSGSACRHQPGCHPLQQTRSVCAHMLAGPPEWGGGGGGGGETNPPLRCFAVSAAGWCMVVIAGCFQRHSPGPTLAQPECDPVEQTSMHSKVAPASSRHPGAGYRVRVPRASARSSARGSQYMPQPSLLGSSTRRAALGLPLVRRGCQRRMLTLAHAGAIRALAAMLSAICPAPVALEGRRQRRLTSGARAKADTACDDRG